MLVGGADGDPCRSHIDGNSEVIVGSTAKSYLANLAAVAGYADQAHITREVRRFSNCTPTILFRSAEACPIYSRVTTLFQTTFEVDDSKRAVGRDGGGAHCRQASISLRP